MKFVILLMAVLLLILYIFIGYNIPKRMNKRIDDLFLSLKDDKDEYFRKIDELCDKQKNDSDRELYRILKMLGYIVIQDFQQAMKISEEINLHTLIYDRKNHVIAKYNAMQIRYYFECIYYLYYFDKTEEAAALFKKILAYNDKQLQSLNSFILADAMFLYHQNMKDESLLLLNGLKAKIRDKKKTKLNEALNKSMYSDIVYFYLGFIMLDRGNKEQGTEYLRKASQQNFSSFKFKADKILEKISEETIGGSDVQI